MIKKRTLSIKNLSISKTLSPRLSTTHSWLEQSPLHLNTLTPKQLETNRVSSALPAKTAVRRIHRNTRLSELSEALSHQYEHSETGKMRLKDLRFITHNSTFKSPSLKLKTELAEALADYKKAKTCTGNSVEKLSIMMQILHIVAENGGILQDDLSKLFIDLESFLFFDMKKLTPLFKAKVYEMYIGKAYSDAAGDSADRVPYYYLHIIANDLISDLSKSNTELMKESILKAKGHN